jgi:hypothetical protein
MKQTILVLLLTVLFNIVSYSQSAEDIPQIIGMRRIITGKCPFGMKAPD